tara:strand:+ start:3382 stop:5928 length:2547 start_codon:yes stop_codon:yes gene_type:complete
MYESSTLWKESFSNIDTSENSKSLRLLSSVFDEMRKKSAQLVENIKADFPGLTIHDVTHLDALWDMGDILCGDDIRLNPLETFVFGAAILIHDSALAYAAYDGQEQLRKDPIWSDIFSLLKRQNPSEDDVYLQSQADFSTIRKKHASQARTLITKEWSFKNKISISLLESSDLKKALHQSIGKIAESHHWDIQRVFSDLKSNKSGPTNLPKSWTINERKIACLLRCADAMHIDERRAPNFIFVIGKRHGVSFEHWNAQNNLSAPVVERGELQYTTYEPFTSEECSSWWQCLELLKVIDNEIKQANSQLTSHGGKAFPITGVKNIHNLLDLQKDIETIGWKAHEVSIHTNNVKKIVRDLGGEQLYGKSCNKLYIVVRELIQNARDAIVARRSIENEFITKGKITIFIEETNGRTWLHVSDNGVGMSQRTLTTTLLDFSSSFWESDNVIDEFSGLSKSNFKSVGQYGVGFYSTFMLADKVEISSRRYDKGHADTNSLYFNDGISLRPIFKNSASTKHGSSFNTCISLLVKEVESEINEQIVSGSNNQKVNVDLEDFLSRLCCGLDVKVKLERNGSITTIHDPIMMKEDGAKWLNKIAYTKYVPNIHSLKLNLDSDISRMRAIKEGSVLHGYAAISTIPSNDFIANSNKTVGGLASTLNAMTNEYFTGYINYESEQASRVPSANTTASKETIRRWASDQRTLLNNETPLSKLVASCYLSRCGVDPSTILSGLVLLSNGQQGLLTLAQLAQLAKETGLGFVGRGLESGHGNFTDQYAEQKPLDGLTRVTPYPFDSNYHSLELIEDSPSIEFSFIWCICHEITRQGNTYEWSRESNYARGFGSSLDLVTLRAK